MCVACVWLILILVTAVNLKEKEQSKKFVFILFRHNKCWKSVYFIRATEPVFFFFFFFCLRIFKMSTVVAFSFHSRMFFFRLYRAFIKPVTDQCSSDVCVSVNLQKWNE